MEFPAPCLTKPVPHHPLHHDPRGTGSESCHGDTSVPTRTTFSWSSPPSLLGECVVARVECGRFSRSALCIATPSQAPNFFQPQPQCWRTIRPWCTLCFWLAGVCFDSKRCGACGEQNRRATQVKRNRCALSSSQGSFSMGDGVGSNNLHDYTVTVANNVDDYIIGTKTWTYTFPNATNNGAPYYVNYASCCRLSTLKNGKGG